MWFAEHSRKVKTYIRHDGDHHVLLHVELAPGYMRDQRSET